MPPRVKAARRGGMLWLPGSEAGATVQESSAVKMRRMWLRSAVQSHHSQRTQRLLNTFSQWRGLHCLHLFVLRVHSLQLATLHVLCSGSGGGMAGSWQWATCLGSPAEPHQPPHRLYHQQASRRQAPDPHSPLQCTSRCSA